MCVYFGYMFAESVSWVPLAQIWHCGHAKFEFCRTKHNVNNVNCKLCIKIIKTKDQKKINQ